MMILDSGLLFFGPPCIWLQVIATWLNNAHSVQPVSLRLHQKSTHV